MTDLEVLVREARKREAADARIRCGGGDKRSCDHDVGYAYVLTDRTVILEVLGWSRPRDSADLDRAKRLNGGQRVEGPGAALRTVHAGSDGRLLGSVGWGKVGCARHAREVSTEALAQLAPDVLEGARWIGVRAS